MLEQFDYCIRALATNVGRKRAANEDSLGEQITPNGLVAVVCDGMGGHVGGAEASRTAVSSILGYLTENYFDNPADAISAAINVANRAILDRQMQQPSLAGMGSTCVMAIVRGGKVWYGWVGDSRIYLVRQNTIVQLSKDESVVQALVDAGQITPAEAEHHARKNEITNCLGIPTMTPAQVCECPLTPQPGDTMLLCSDGLSGMISNSQIADIVSDRANLRLPARANALIDAANAAGGLDNITALLLEFPSGSQVAQTPRPAMPEPHELSRTVIRRRMSPWVWRGAAIGVAAIALTVGGFFMFRSCAPDSASASVTVAGKDGKDVAAKTSAKADDKNMAPFTGVSTSSVIYVNNDGLPKDIIFALRPTDDKENVWQLRYADKADGDDICMTVNGSLTQDMLSLLNGQLDIVKDDKKAGYLIVPQKDAEIKLPMTVSLTVTFPAADGKKPPVVITANIKLGGLPG